MIVNIDSPIYIQIGKTANSKKYSLNLNQYRNWHFRTSNAIKRKYKEEMRPLIQGLKLKPPIGIEYVVYYKDRRIYDRNNILSVVDKFFCDALVQVGVLPDDCDTYIQYSLYRTGGIDRENPRVEITISELGI